jgi:hypothetical protein
MEQGLVAGHIHDGQTKLREIQKGENNAWCRVDEIQEWADSYAKFN